MKSETMDITEGKTKYRLRRNIHHGVETENYWIFWGRGRSRSTNETDFEQAKKKFLTFIANNEGGSQQGTKLTWDGVNTLWRKAHLGKIAHMDRHDDRYRRICRKLGPMSLERTSQEFIDQLLDDFRHNRGNCRLLKVELSEPSLSDNGLVPYVAVLRKLIKHAVDRRLVDPDKMPVLPAAPKYVPRMDYYTPEETARLRSALEARNPLDGRPTSGFLWFIIALTTGCRRERIESIRWSLFNWKTRKADFKRVFAANPEDDPRLKKKTAPHGELGQWVTGWLRRAYEYDLRQCGGRVAEVNKLCMISGTIEPTNIYPQFREVLTDVFGEGHEKGSPHTVRHTYFTRGVDLGISLDQLAVSSDTNPRTISGVYLHYVEGRSGEIAGKLEADLISTGEKVVKLNFGKAKDTA